MAGTVDAVDMVMVTDVADTVFSLARCHRAYACLM